MHSKQKSKNYGRKRMTDALMDRIKAHRSAPDVYDPPTFDQMADRIEQTEAKLTRAVEFLKTMVDYNKYVIAPFLAELGGEE
jgi:hypothetical protein